MAVNPILGPIVNKVTSDPNGTPGQTSGGVAVTPPMPEAKLPTAGDTASLPPFFSSPKRDPLAETFAPPVGPMQ